MKNRLFLLLCVLIPMLTANCSDKKSVEKTAKTETTEATARQIKLSNPPFKKFIVVSEEGAKIHKKADNSSPTLVCWAEDCEGDDCEMLFKWSDEPGKAGYNKETDMAYVGRLYPVTGEEGNFYKVNILTETCDIESGFLSKDLVASIDYEPINAADLKNIEEPQYKYLVITEGKNKGFVLIDQEDELWGETLMVGMLINGIIAVPCDFTFDCSNNNQQQQPIAISKSDNRYYLEYSNNMKVVAEEGYEIYQLDPKKLGSDQIDQIIGTFSNSKPDLVMYFYHFPARGLQTFYSRNK